MKQNITHISLDAGDTRYHGSALNEETGVVIAFKRRLTLKGLLQQLNRMARPLKGYKIKLCTGPPTSAIACSRICCAHVRK